jgi:chaperonin GroEL
MTPKSFKFSTEARVKILKGINTLADAVMVTLGPRGKCVVIQKQFGVPHVTKDGVTVAREVFLEDPFEDMGAQMVKQVASKTADVAGDGTTTATVLAQSIVNEGAKLVAAEHNPTNLKRGIDFAIEKIVGRLSDMSKPISSKKEIAQIGTISSNGDEKVGKLIADAMEQVGNEGIISLEEGKAINTELTVVNGYQFDRGYLSQHLITNENLECMLEDPIILLCEGALNNVNIMLPILESCHKHAASAGKPLLIIAEDVSGEALATLVINHLKRSFISCAVKAPGFGDRRKEMLNDLAIFTGATLVSEETGLKLEQFDPLWLGTAKSAKITKGSTVIIEGGGSAENVENRVREVRSAVQAATSDWDKEKQEERLAKLVGGAAIIAVGAATEAEMKEKKDRVEDALSATRAAVQEGIVAGGGVALLRAAKVLDEIEIPKELVNGVNIVKKAVEEPIRKIAMNAGQDPSYVKINVMAKEEESFGFNARTEEFCDLVEAGVIDPVKVVRCALQNAASIAGLVLTTECMIANKPKKEDPKPGGMPVM